MQLGVQNDEAADIARAAGIEVIQNQCIEIEHMALQRNH
jgi:predicted CoA-binding protein